MALPKGQANQNQGLANAKPGKRPVGIDQLITAGGGIEGGGGGYFSLTPISDGQVLANISGVDASPVGESLSDVMDHDLGGAQGDIAIRSSAAWTVLAPSTDGDVLTTHGAGADPTWETPSIGSSLELTDGTHDVLNVAKITVSGMTVGGATPNATLTVSGGIGGASFFKQSIGVSGTTTVIGRFVSPYVWTFPSVANGGIGVGKVDTAPSSDTDFDILKNGVATTATVRFTSGSTTATFINSADISIAVGDYIDIKTPSNLNGMTGVWGVSILGTRP